MGFVFYFKSGVPVEECAVPMEKIQEEFAGIAEWEKGETIVCVETADGAFAIELYPEENGLIDFFVINHPPKNPDLWSSVFNILKKYRYYLAIEDEMGLTELDLIPIGVANPEVRNFLPAGAEQPGMIDSSQELMTKWCRTK